MFRALKLSSVCNLRKTQNFETIYHSRLKCTLCTHHTSYKPLLEPKYKLRRHIRYQSSRSTTLQRDELFLDQRKDKFTDILEVSLNRSNETNENKGESLSISDPNEEFEHEDHSENTLGLETKAVLEELEEMQEEGHRVQATLVESMLTEISEQPSKQESAKPPVKKNKHLSKETREKLAKVKYEDLEKGCKEQSLAISLISYLEICINCGFVNRGLATLNFYLTTRPTIIKDIKLFDILMEGYAKVGNVDKVNEIWQLFQNHGIKPSLTSFARRIEAIARSSKANKAELLTTCFKELSANKLSLDLMFNDCIWKRDSREITLQAVKSIYMNFTPKKIKPNLSYNNKLVDKLNNKENSFLKSPAEGLFTPSESKALFEEQLKVEIDTFLNVKSIEKVEHSKSVDYYRKKLDEMKTKWEKRILLALNRELSALNVIHRNITKSYKQLNIYPYLVYLDKHQYKDIIMDEIARLAEGSENFSQSSVILHRSIGYQIRLRYDVKRKTEDGILDKMKYMYKDYFRWYLNPSEEDHLNSRQCWQSLKYKYNTGPSTDCEIDSWPPNILLALGKFLYNIILKDIKIDVNVMKHNCQDVHLLPAFYSIFRQEGYWVKEEVKPHPVLSKLFRAAALPDLKFSVTNVPMLTPPIPWTNIQTGGYVVAKTNLIRLPHQAIQQTKRLKGSSPTEIYPCLDALNQLGSVPWVVNEPILDLIIRLFNNGGLKKLDIPEPPTSFQFVDNVPFPPDTSERFQAYRRRLLIRKRKAEMYSMWCDTLYRLSLANHFRDRVFWLPHNMDFRGRVYPCPPHLNHLGSDLSRSLLKFAKGELLGPKGLDWLKIHLINLTGLKKRQSNAERLTYANEMLPKILDSAEKPLDGERWWMESEEPWQTLACSMEIRAALNHLEGPENYVSQFPVHQDGSCNGLQHYAALGRDTAGAYSVNLSPAETPQDVYSAVAAIVERQRSEDAANGLKIAQVLEGFVKRKVIKQTVMTTVYGVTRFGARLQIAKQLKDIDEFPKEYVWPSSTYLVTKTFDSLREMFTSTREIQDWFTESARLISSVCGQNVEYVTPLGLPVVQPYSRNKDNNKRNINPLNVNEYSSLDMYERPNVMKQKNAFPPNFIHSLDSTHMMLTSLHCEQAGITFVSVHDCYWSHPRHLEILNRICREQFVSLHSQPILTDLSEFLLKKFSYSEDDFVNNTETMIKTKRRLNSVLKKVPSKGDFELKNVLDSEYFFS